MTVRVSAKERDYILNAIVLLRAPGKYGINVEWSGLRESFELDFKKPFNQVILELARRKVILMRDNKARKGGIVIYNPSDLPKSLETRLWRAQRKIHREK